MKKAIKSSVRLLLLSVFSFSVLMFYAPSALAVGYHWDDLHYKIGSKEGVFYSSPLFYPWYGINVYSDFDLQSGERVILSYETADGKPVYVLKLEEGQEVQTVLPYGGIPYGNTPGNPEIKYRIVVSGDGFESKEGVLEVSYYDHDTTLPYPWEEKE